MLRASAVGRMSLTLSSVEEPLMRRYSGDGESRGVKRERDLIRAKSLRVYEDISDVSLNIG